MKSHGTFNGYFLSRTLFLILFLNGWLCFFHGKKTTDITNSSRAIKQYSIALHQERGTAKKRQTAILFIKQSYTNTSVEEYNVLSYNKQHQGHIAVESYTSAAVQLDNRDIQLKGHRRSHEEDDCKSCFIVLLVWVIDQ